MRKIRFLIYIILILIFLLFLLWKQVNIYKEVNKIQQEQIEKLQNEQEQEWRKKKEILYYAKKIKFLNNFLSWKECYYYADYILYLIDKKQYKLHPSLIIHLIQVESSWRNWVRTSVAYGYMQVNYGVWYQTYAIPSPSYLYNPFYNIEIGTDIFYNYYKNSRSLKEALKKYSGNTTSQHYYNFVMQYKQEYMQ